ncbi:MAG: peptidyl-alpha-hydroxyglycine alpha-amidating lyase family protein [Gammaproteobacteria bacterium]|nr:peptidyl-alpha-hydroxyglycine alpha-amidating lyase family protein [Gammaproteobacteria bacterium]
METALIIGSGDYRYSIESWPTLPAGWVLGDVAGVAVSDKDEIYLFTRGERPLLVFDSAGNLLRHWGEGQFVRPHGIDLGPDGTIYCTDDGAHVVRTFTPEGKELLRIGLPGEPEPMMSGLPFNKCTHTALSPSGDIYVSDGYGNARVHKYSPNGKLLFSWGGPGISPGEFNFPHNIVSDADGWLYVADRENHRVQVFNGNGKFETQWHSLHRPCALCKTNGTNPLFYVGELGPSLAANITFPNLGPRISVVAADGSIVARVGDEVAGLETNQFVAPHGIAVDSLGNIYLGEVSYAGWPQFFPGQDLPDTLRTMRKLVRVP